MDVLNYGTEKNVKKTCLKRTNIVQQIFKNVTLIFNEIFN